MENIYLISPDFVRNFTNISTNMQDKFLLSSIREASDIDYQEIVGSNLYIKLKELIANDQILEPDYIQYKSLLDMSKYFLAYAVVARVVVISSVKLDNIGANQTEDDKVKALEIKDVFTLQNYYQQKADFYKKRLQDYLKTNQEYFPEMKCNVCNDVNPNLKSAFSVGISLGGARGKSYN